jgi:hypothetical protein
MPQPSPAENRPCVEAAGRREGEPPRHVRHIRPNVHRALPQPANDRERQATESSAFSFGIRGATLFNKRSEGIVC